MKYHVRIDRRDKDSEWIFDLSDEELIERIVRPYETGENLFLNGTTVELEEIERVEIRRTQKPIEQIVDEIRNRRNEARRRRANAGFVSFRPVRVSKEEAYRTGENVLEEFISGPPNLMSPAAEVALTSEQVEQSNRIFIVHGHNNEMKETVARFLSESGLEPIILHEQPNQGKTIIEKFEEYADVQFAIVILSGDDYGYAKSGSEEDKLLRARQNVILEMGYFIGKIGRKNVCILHEDIGNLEIPSDYGGVMYVKFNEAWRVKVAKELNAANYHIDLKTLLK